MKINIKLFDWFFVLRPTLFFPVWTVFLAGYHCQHRFQEAEIPQRLVDESNNPGPYGLIGIVVFLTLLMGGVFILNQIKDIISDRLNNKLFLIANDHFKQTYALLEAGILIIAAVSFSFYFNLKIGLLFVIIFLLAGILYSFQPFSWKDKPFPGLLTNALGGFLIFSVGWLVKGHLTTDSILHALPYVLAVAAVYLYTTLPDVKGDKLSGKITFGVKYGPKITIYSALGFEILAVITSSLVRDFFILFPALLSFPFFLWATVSLELRDVLRTTKLSILFLSMAFCLKYPVYFLMLLFVFFFSKWYYKKRFGIHYPSFSA